MKKNFFLIFPVILILFLAISLRFFRLGEVPIELNRDEASLGYTAYSLLKTGHDEHGVTWPISIQSFGDWKLPGYVYTLIPFIKIFGLENWVIKLPSALAGVGIVILAGANTWLLTTGWKNSKRRYFLSLLVSLMIAISPWNIHLSHMAYEANLALFFFMFGFFFFQIGLQKTTIKKLPLLVNSSSLFILLSIFFFGLTLFTYHSYQIFTPLMALGLLFIFKNKTLEIFKNHRKTFFTSLILAGIFSITLVVTSLTANQIKFSGLSIFDKNAYAQIIQINRGFFNNQNSLLAKLQTNYPALMINQIQRNLADIFSTKFLFFEGGNHGSHDIPGTGKLYPIALIFILIAASKFFQDFRQKKLQKWQKIVILWLGISIIAPAITFEAAHTIRFSPALFSLEFLSAYGLFLILISPHPKKAKKIALIIISLILFYSTLNFALTYFIIAPKRDINHQNWQMKKIVSLIQAKKDNYQAIIMPGSSWSPYIYFLYYTRYDPSLLEENLEFYPQNNEGFRHVKSLENIYFENPNWNEREQTDQKILYVIKRKEVSIDKLESKSYKIEYSLTNDYARDQWLFLSYE